MEYPGVHDLETNDRSFIQNSNDHNDFVLWLTSGQEAYPERVARRFIRNMCLAPPRFDISLESQARDVFRCKTVIELDHLWSVFKDAPNYHEINSTSNRGAFVAGLTEYRRYLSETEQKSLQRSHPLISLQYANRPQQKNNDLDDEIKISARLQLAPTIENREYKSSKNLIEYDPQKFELDNTEAYKMTFGEYCERTPSTFEDVPIDTLTFSCC
jgi:hypothetical protein